MPATQRTDEMTEHETQDFRWFLNSFHRLSERQAAFEGKVGSDIENLKKDTEMIRSQGHEFRNDLQKIMIHVTKMTETMMSHVDICDTRGKRLEKIAWLVVGLVMGALGFLIKVTFFHGAP